MSKTKIDLKTVLYVGPLILSVVFFIFNLDKRISILENDFIDLKGELTDIEKDISNFKR